jgi:hypothetical protein
MIISSDTPRPVPPAPSPGVVPERVPNEERVDWTRVEHQVLHQAIAQAAATGQRTRAWQIFECHAWFLSGQGYWADARQPARQCWRPPRLRTSRPRWAGRT